MWGPGPVVGATWMLSVPDVVDVGIRQDLHWTLLHVVCSLRAQESFTCPWAQLS